MTKLTLNKKELDYNDDKTYLSIGVVGSTPIGEAIDSYHLSRLRLEIMLGYEKNILTSEISVELARIKELFEMVLIKEIMELYH